MAQEGSPNSFADQVLLDDLQGFLRQEQEDPANHLAPYQAAMIYTRLGHYGQAVQSYQRAIERFPDFQQAYYNMGAAYSSLGRHEEAEQAYHRAIALDETDSEAWANLGAIQEAQGRYDNALTSFGKAYELEPGESEARLRMARIHLARDEFEAARTICEDVLERDAESAEAWNDLGLVRYHQGERTGAEGCYRKALDLRPDYAQAWSNLGNLHAAGGEEQDAEASYRRALECDEHDADIWFNLGEFYFQRGNLEAERCLWRVVEHNRDDLETWELLRRWYAGHPNPERMLTALRVLALARPEDTELLAELARAAEMERDFELAAESFRKLLEVRPDDEAAHLGLVRVRLKEGQVLDAYRHLREVEAGTPDVVDQWIHLGHRLSHRGRHAEAEDCFARALRHRPGEPELAHYLGEIALERGERDRAFEHFERAGELNRNDRHVWIPLMRAFYDAKDYDHAAACLDHLEELAQHLTGLWVEFDEVYGRAGRRDELLGRFERWLELGVVAAEHWTTLADLFAGAGLDERARHARARAAATVPAGGGDGALQPQYLEPRGPAPELATESTESTESTEATESTESTESGDVDAPAADAPGPETTLGTADAEYWIEQSEGHLHGGRIDDAVASLNRAVSLDIPRFRAWFRIGGLFYLLGKLGEAEAAFRRATALNPEETKGWYNVGVCLAEQGRLEEARADFERALSLNRRAAKAWDWLGLLHFNAGRQGEAHRCFVRCLAVSRTSANAWHNLGMLYRAMGNASESQRCLAEARRLGGVKEKEGLVLGAAGA